MTTLRPLNAELQQAAIEQLNEKPENIASDIEALKLWIKQQPHLRARTDDQLLLGFLRGCKYSLEKTKSKIDRIYMMRTKFPDIFGCRDIEKDRILEILKLGAVFYLPTPLNEHGPRIGMMRMGVFSPDQYHITEIFRVSQVLHEISIIEDDYAVINGVVNVMDAENVSTALFLQSTPALMKKMTVWIEQAVPLRLKANHYINTPAAFEPIFKIFKPMLSKKQQNRLFVHGNKMESLYKQVPQKYLPKEYGGENGSIDEILKEWEQRILKYREYFKEEANYGTDEKLRPGKPIDFEGIFGMDGSFRKLNID